MNFHEYQAKQLFAEFGIAVPSGKVAKTPAEAVEAAIARTEAVNPAFHYVTPDFMRVPMWLPALYACVTPALGQLARRLIRPSP